MTRARRGPFIAATWLIGLGVVFLVRQSLDIPWNEAWPLFIILVGVVGLVTTALNGFRGLADVWSFTWPVVVTVAGVILLASTTGRLSEGPLETLDQWWPVALVVIGVWFLIGAFVPRGAPQEALVLPLEGATEASIWIKFGAGELATVPAQPGDLIDGHFAGGVVVRRDDSRRIELAQDTTFGIPWLDHRSDWTVGLSGEVPLDLRIDTGAARAHLDLSNLLVRSLELHTGASETRIRLPRNAGATSVRAETGAASLVIEVPTGVGARIRSRIGLGSTDVDQGRFPREGEGYASADYATAPNRADIDVQGGVGSVRIVGVA
jgi:LiaI-LiaF-like transmembrane region